MVAIMHIIPNMHLCCFNLSFVEYDINNTTVFERGARSFLLIHKIITNITKNTCTISYNYFYFLPLP